MNNNTNRFFTFIFSFIPGVGHLLLGMTNRGVQLLLLFLASIYLSNFVGLFGFVTAFTVIFSVFDILQKHRIYNATGIMEDELLFKWDYFKNNRKLWGYGFVGLGVVYILNNVMEELLPRYSYLLDQSVFAVILIGLGVYLLKGKKLPSFIEEVEEEKVVETPISETVTEAPSETKGDEKQ